MTASGHRPNRRHAPSSLLAPLVLIITLTLSLLAWHMAMQEQRAHEQADFNFQTVFTITAIQQRLQHYADILASVRSLFYASDDVTRRDFQAYVDTSQIPQRYPGIQALGYIHSLVHEDVKPFVQQVRELQQISPCGYPDFIIRPQGERPEYQVVTFVEPIVQNMTLVGRDLLMDPACRRAMELARDTGQARISGILNLQRGEEKVTGFSLVLPLYDAGLLIDASVTQRRDALVGFVFAGFITPEFFRGIFGDRVLTDIDFEVFDGAQIRRGRLLYDDDMSLHATDMDYPARYRRLETIELFGRDWSLYFSAPPEYLHSTANMPWLILAGGVLSSILLFLLTHGYVRNTHARLRYAQELEYQATHDALTKLPNRSALYSRLNGLLSGDNPSFALLMMDLDGFKEVNDTLGHHSGDMLLRQLGPRILAAIGPQDLLVRLGGDEFALLIVPAGDTQAVVRQAGKLLNLVQQPFDLEDIEVQVDASIGIALAPMHGDDSSLLMRHADVAMYAAKRRRSNIMLYNPELDLHSPRRLALMSELARAIDDNQLELHYQPKLRLDDGRFAGVEALVRWNHPHEGMIPPADFIPQAETGSVIKPLTYWVIEAALRQCREWHRLGLEVEVAVNISARNLMDADLPVHVAKLTQALGVPAYVIETEVTESAIVMDPETADRILTRLHDQGVKIAIDDFGTGYTSIEHLKRLQVSHLKIDRSFVGAMETDDDNALIVSSIIGLAHDLGMAVIAEGVENEQTLMRLKSLDCDYAQGFHICRPLPAQEMTEWLRNSLSKSQGVGDD